MNVSISCPFAHNLNIFYICENSYFWVLAVQNNQIAIFDHSGQSSVRETRIFELGRGSIEGIFKITQFSHFAKNLVIDLYIGQNNIG